MCDGRVKKSSKTVKIFKFVIPEVIVGDGEPFHVVALPKNVCSISARQTAEMARLVECRSGDLKTFTTMSYMRGLTFFW